MSDTLLERLATLDATRGARWLSIREDDEAAQLVRLANAAPQLWEALAKMLYSYEGRDGRSPDTDWAAFDEGCVLARAALTTAAGSHP